MRSLVAKILEKYLSELPLVMGIPRQGVKTACSGLPYNEGNKINVKKDRWKIP